MATYLKREMIPNNFGMHFPYCIYIELFFFTLIRNGKGSHIMGLGGRNVKARCALLLWLSQSFCIYVKLSSILRTTGVDLLVYPP